MTGRINDMIQKILIVDDDTDTQRGLGVLLKADGYDVSSASDAITGVIAAKRTDPDLVILDLGLPGGDGFTVLEQLRAHRPSAPVPVVVLTARDPLFDRARALAAGAVAFLQKPAGHQELLAAIRAHIGNPQPALKKILIVEDDADTQKGLAVLLKSEGFVTSFASDAATVLPIAAREEPDVILLDLGLPAGDGLKVLERLRKHPTLNRAPVIVVSARSPAANEPKALQAGAEAFFQKPPDFEELLRSVRKAVGTA
jgi:DNA-binding response OmpR family regulator